MPFTVSHVAAVLPFRKKTLSFSALAIGSMSPDFAYIVALFGPRLESHTLLGIFTFCLPSSLLVWFLYDRWLEKPWSRVFPWLEKDSLRIPYLNVWISALLGVLTHLAWDSLTHRYGWPVEHFEFLRAPIQIGFGPAKPVYNLLQHLSSALGLTLIVIALRRRILRDDLRVFASATLLIQSLACFTVFALLLCAPMAFSARGFFDDATFEIKLVQLAFRLLAAIALTLIFFPLVLRVTNRTSAS